MTADNPATPGEHFMNPAGLPRLRNDGPADPWITSTGTDDPEWLGVDRTWFIACQTGWLCQGCGQDIPRRAWLVLNDDNEVVSNAPLCRPCLTTALRWCLPSPGPSTSRLPRSLPSGSWSMASH
jgi:hypothetical protein